MDLGNRVWQSRLLSITRSASDERQECLIVHPCPAETGIWALNEQPMGYSFALAENYS